MYILWEWPLTALTCNQCHCSDNRIVSNLTIAAQHLVFYLLPLCSGSREKRSPVHDHLTSPRHAPQAACVHPFLCMGLC